MPSYVVAPNAICEIVQRGMHENQQVLSVFHYRYTDASPIADGAAMLDLIWNRWNAAGRMLDVYLNALSEKVIAIETRLQWITPDRFAYITKTEPTAPTGKVAGDAYPVNTSGAITKRTINAGRDQIGTLHMPGVPITFIGNGSVRPAGLAAYAALATEMTVDIVTLGTVANLSPVLFKKSSPDISPKFVNCTVQPTARVERRRTVGVGS